MTAHEMFECGLSRAVCVQAEIKSWPSHAAQQVAASHLWHEGEVSRALGLLRAPRTPKLLAWLDGVVGCVGWINSSSPAQLALGFAIRL